jgi:hypothetical protein
MNEDYIMRIKPDGSHKYRLDLPRRVMQRTGEGTKSGAFDFSTAFTLQMLDALEEASQPPDLSFSQTPYTEAGTPIGTICGFNEGGLFVTTPEGAEQLSIEYARSGHEFGTAGLMWRCTGVGR